MRCFGSFTWLLLGSLFDEDRHTHVWVCVCMCVCNQLYVWNVDTHPSKPKNDDKTYPNLILEGHQDIADFALGMSSTNSSCASGGKVRIRASSLFAFARCRPLPSPSLHTSRSPPLAETRAADTLAEERHRFQTSALTPGEKAIIESLSVCCVESPGTDRAVSVFSSLAVLHLPRVQL